LHFVGDDWLGGGRMVLNGVGDDWLGGGRMVLNGVGDRYRESEVRRVGKSKDPLYPLNRRLSGPQGRSGLLKMRKIIWHRQGLELGTSGL